MSDTALIVSLVKNVSSGTGERKFKREFDHLCFAQHFYSRDVVVSKFEDMFCY